MKKWLVMFGVLILTLALVACSGDDSKDEAEGTKKSEETKTGEDTEKGTAEKVTLSFFTAQPDRTTGMGAIEQQIIDAYMDANPNVTIEVEALQDEPYKDKIKIYSSVNDLPDILHTWGQPSFIDPLLNNGLLHELNPEDFADLGFIEGSMSGFSKGDSVYGIPKNTDFLVLYYNKRLFEENGVELPKTQEDLVDVSKKLREKGISPIAINGMDGWTLPMWFEYVLQREAGSFDVMDDALHGNASFADDVVVAAATTMKEMVDAGIFADGYLTADYGTAANLFGQEGAAMYLMGSWEMSLSQNEDYPESFRQNVGVMNYPISDKSEVGDVLIYHGGGYSIAENSEHKEVAVDFLKFFFQPENWVKLVWQSGAATPAQSFDKYLTGEESSLQKEIIDIFNSVTSSSGTPVLDDATAEFKETIMNLHQELFTGGITPQEFSVKLAEAADKVKQAGE